MNWTILIFSYGTTVLGANTSLIPFPSYEQCSAALNPLHSLIIEEFPDASLTCLDTGLLSKSLRPRPRPESLIHD